MSKFNKNIKVDTETMKKIKAVEKAHQSQGKELELTEKICVAIYTSILEIEAKDIEEKAKIIDSAINISKLARYYEDPEYKDFFKIFWDKVYKREKRDKRRMDKIKL